jgi:hypothetical protein
LVSDSIVATVRATNTGNQSHIITLVTEGSTHYSYVVSTIPTQQGISGSGTSNYLPKWSGSTSLVDSLVYDSSTGVTIGTGFTWNNTNSRLGIGTNSPTGAVTVIGAYSSNTAASLVVQNTIPYSAPNYNQYSQMWLDAGGTALAYVRNDGRFYTTNDIN